MRGPASGLALEVRLDNLTSNVQAAREIRDRDQDDQHSTRQAGPTCLPQILLLLRGGRIEGGRPLLDRMLRRRSERWMCRMDQGVDKHPFQSLPAEGPRLCGLVLVEHKAQGPDIKRWKYWSQAIGRQADRLSVARYPWSSHPMAQKHRRMRMEHRLPAQAPESRHKRRRGAQAKQTALPHITLTLPNATESAPGGCEGVRGRRAGGWYAAAFPTAEELGGDSPEVGQSRARGRDKHSTCLDSDRAS
ncbi:hypothetical protein CALCODRAFT_122469 [Calocera cornea HHB12733]|uniref:Uncharacterized protein n=1 Tax=Calocera cornea HHB12733 TaxID=1353952 RepID=A0A165CYW5_9BASI|nr:hypothetical protein CALCODRAFT_122469 [Calocera cornea HHB12733]